MIDLLTQSDVAKSNWIKSDVKIRWQTWYTQQQYEVHTEVRVAMRWITSTTTTRERIRRASPQPD